ncbi:PREDICTED: multiple organellar RNA editing factor 7, mitochondrial isoform X1 [Tarenaya hassleriana]|uniref:multiple organellar RNA editing factor 7, mitochondrial isoform X1 n=1 Tax=Tarenaya hassleriana TaxID=28532 RepID=UPI00053CA5D5|nr:PREDICTED: multiple organellar RNA editing factor 7, mitochondrial isoform X1 [Tarenaya hassleriana]
MSRIIGRPLNLTASVRRRLAPFSLFSGSSGSDDSVPTRCDELTRVPSLVEGCDYKHWLVVMEVPKGYPPRNDIVGGYVKTLAMALGSEEKAKKSIYSVSTKYYYAFGCRVTELMTYKIQSLPDVKWVLPDSFIDGKNGYGGEPFIDGEVVPYDEKYHADWLREHTDDSAKDRVVVKKPRRKRKKSIN